VVSTRTDTESFQDQLNVRNDHNTTLNSQLNTVDYVTARRTPSRFSQSRLPTPSTRSSVCHGGCEHTVTCAATRYHNGVYARTMDEVEFMRQLQRYRVVRGRDAVLPPHDNAAKPALHDASHVASGSAAAHHRHAAHVGSGENHAPADARTAAPPSALLPIPVKDFWAGLSLFLNAHFAGSDAKAVQAAVEAAHYDLLGERMNWEDIEDVVRAIQIQLDGTAKGAAAQGSGAGKT
jgi:hypothetical protein